MPLTRYTDNAASDKGRLERELERIRRAADALTQTYQENDGAKPRARKSAAGKRRT